MSKKSKLYSFSVLGITIALVIVLADMFSNFITLGNFAFLPTQGLKNNAYSIYAISLAKCATVNQANSLVQDIKMRGGAGYVYSANGVYYLLASAYESENDATKVLDNLKEKEQNCEIVKISVGEINLDINLSGAEKTATNNAIAIFKQTYKTLYDLSVSLDTGVKTLSECKLATTTQLTTCKEVKNNFDQVFSSKLTSEVFKIKLKLAALVMNMQSLIEQDIQQGVLFSSALKQTYIQCVLHNKDLAKELAS
jgi:hypothetical protein